MRSPAEIEAEIEAKKAAGVHPATKELRALRQELAEAQNDGLPKHRPVEIDVKAELAKSVDVPRGTLGGEEWAFIERVLTEISIPRNMQSSSHAKAIYNEVKQKVQIWRVLREVVADVGIGNRWPQWVELGRDGATGEKESEKEARIAAQTAVEAEKRAAMPQPQQPTQAPRSGPLPPGAESFDDFASAIRSGIAAAVASGEGPPDF